jgi:general secretion pathway protein G
MPASHRQQDAGRARLGGRRPPRARRAPSGPTRHSPTARRAFSLVELVVVVVIVGILAAIAIPRFTSAGESATDSALAADLETLRKAIDLYHGEHLGKYPDLARVSDQLTQYTDVHGNVSPTRTSAHSLGPYVRAIPALKVGPTRGSTGIAAAAGDDVGWVYDETSGEITAAAPSKDRRGRPYGEY